MSHHENDKFSQYPKETKLETIFGILGPIVMGLIIGTIVILING